MTLMAAFCKVLPVPLLLTFLAGASLGQKEDRPEGFYKIDQKMCDTIQDDMTEAQVREIIGGRPQAQSRTVFAAPFSNKAMPVIRKQWWGEKNLIEVHFDERSKTVIYTRILEGTDRRFTRPESK